MARPERGVTAGGLRAAAVALSLAAASPTSAACIVPAPPDPAGRPVKPALPVKGPCVDAKAGTTGCLGWEAYTYNDDVKAYNEQAKAWKTLADAYVAKLNAYVQASGEYARCEIGALQ